MKKRIGSMIVTDMMIILMATLAIPLSSWVTITSGIKASVLDSDNQHLGITINPSNLSVSAPGNFTFGSVTSGSQGFSNTDVDYLPTVTVTDGRGSSGFNLQIQADTTGFGNGAGNYLPLQNLWVVTTSTTLNGIEYDGSDTDPQTIVAPQDTIGSLQNADSFTNDGLNLGTGSTSSTPGNPTPVDLMLGGTSDGRIGTFTQDVNFFLNVPSDQPIGNYTITLTYTVTDSNSL